MAWMPGLASEKEVRSPGHCSTLSRVQGSFHAREALNAHSYEAYIACCRMPSFRTTDGPRTSAGVEGDMALLD